VTSDADLLVNSYLSWLQNDISASSLNETVSELTTPFIDRHNDHLQIYAERRSPEPFFFKNEGYILSQLKSSGGETKGKKREEFIKGLLAGHGIRLEGRELQTDATAADLGKRVHSLVQAMLSVDDMFVFAHSSIQPSTVQPSTVQPFFLQEVERFFDNRAVRYTSAAKFAGKSGLDHLINFVIPKSKRAPERFIQVMNTPRRDRVENLLFVVSDTKSARQGDVDFYAIVNDTRRAVSPDILHAFDAYQVKAIPWSRRDQMIEELVV